MDWKKKTMIMKKKKKKEERRRFDQSLRCEALNLFE